MAGEPCLVGAWFRVTPDGTRPGDWHVTHDEEPADPPDGWNVWVLWDRARSGLSWGREYRADSMEEAMTWAKSNLSGVERSEREPARLNMTTVWRSHDLFGAYPTNLAGILLWLIRTAENHGMEVGTLTCISMSAHVYERDWNAANEMIEKHYDTNHEPLWDRRSTWHVEKVTPVVEVKPVLVGETLQVPRPASGRLDVWEVQAEPAGPDMFVIENQTSGERVRIQGSQWRDMRGDFRGLLPDPIFRATALTPDGKEVVAKFEATTVEALRGQIERSGLVTSVGGALWLGDQIRRVGGG